jgi:hypothetical protein
MFFVWVVEGFTVLVEIFMRSSFLNWASGCANEKARI